MVSTIKDIVSDDSVSLDKAKPVDKDTLKKFIDTVRERLDEGHESVKNIKYPKLFLASLEELDGMVGMSRFKNEMANKTKELITNINAKETNAGKLHTVIYSPPGTGKCFKKGTEILMYNGTIQLVEKIKIGDKIMGDDSTERNVLDLGRGRDLMYEITNDINETFICNKEHILCLKYVPDIFLRDSETSECFEIEYFDPIKNMTSISFFNYKSLNKSYVKFQVEQEIKSVKEKLNIIEIPVKDYVNLSRKNNLYLYKVALTFKYSEIKEDAYIFGKSCDYKNIPDNYLFNTYSNRDKLLSGICDTKANYNKTMDRYEFIIPSESLKFLARGLGLRTESIGNNFYIYNFKNSLYNFEVKELSMDEYYGFVLDGNHRFLLGDFTVSHNTTCGIILAKIFYSLGYLKTESNVKKKNNSEMDVESLQFVYIMIYLLAIFIPLFYKLYGAFKTLYKDYPLILITTILIIVLFIYHEKLRIEIEKQSFLDSISDGNVDSRNIISVVTRGDFVAGYVGQTALKTRKLLEENRGKVLFIDEAYTLYDCSGHGGDIFGQEALDELNLFMDENKESITVIFAGYEDKLRNGIFTKQPGLARRCQYHFEIDDYTPDELALIFKKQLLADGYEIENMKEVEKEFKKNMMYFKNFGGDTERLKGYVMTEKKQQTFDTGEVNVDNIIRKTDVIAGIDRLKQNDITTKKKKVFKT